MKHQPQLSLASLRHLIDWSESLTGQAKDMGLLKTCQWRLPWHKIQEEEGKRTKNINQHQRD